MQKILISAAIITGLIAPAIYATVTYTDSVKSQKNTGTVTQSGGTLSGAVSPKNKISCMRESMRKYTKDKKSLSVMYRSKIQKSMKSVLTAVSGEKKLRTQEVKKLQQEYDEALKVLKEKYTQTQATCNIK